MGEVLAYVGRNQHPNQNLKDLQASAFPSGDSPYAPLEDHPSAACREPSALEGWILEVIYCDPKESKAFLRILSTEKRSGRLC